MLGTLPRSVNVNGTSLELNTDYHIALFIFEGIEDPILTEQDKVRLIFNLLYKNPELITHDIAQEALDKACWFLDGGEDRTQVKSNKPVMSWTQDENYIFAAINDKAGRELRDETVRMHWWTFLAYFNMIGDCFFARIVETREKMNQGKKLESYEKEFYAKNKKAIDLKTKRTDSEQEAYDAINKLYGGG